MLKWSFRLLVVLLAAAALLYYFHVRLGDGRMTVEPRSENERQQLNEKVRRVLPVEPDQETPPPVTPAAPEKNAPAADISDQDRRALESILEEEL